MRVSWFGHHGYKKKIVFICEFSYYFYLTLTKRFFDIYIYIYIKFKINAF